MPEQKPSRLGRALAANTMHAASGRIASLVVWLLYTPYLLSALGAEHFALWSIFFAVTGMLVTVDLGFSQAALRHVSAAHARGDDQEAGEFATLAAALFVGLGIAWTVMAVFLNEPLITWLKFPDSERAAAGFVILAGAVVFAIMGLTLVTMAVAQGYGRFDLANRAMLALTAQQAIGIPIVLSNGWGLRGLIVNVGLGWCTGLIVANALIRRGIPRFRWSSPRRALGRWSEALRFGGPMQIAVAMFALHMHIDKFLLVPLDRLAAVADYELGFRVANAALLLVQMLLLAVLPAAAALHANRESARLERLYLAGSRYVLAAVVILFVPLGAAADRLFAFWLGSPHPDAALVLRGLALASAILALTGMGTSVLRGLGRTSVEAWFAIVMIAAHGALAVWLIPMHGLRGAVFAAAAGTAVGVTFFMWRFAVLVEWRRRSTIVAPHALPLLAALAALAAGTLVDRALPARVSDLWALVAVGGTSATIAIVISFFSGYLKWSELRELATPAAVSR